jgi:hypothetical protein
MDKVNSNKLSYFRNINKKTSYLKREELTLLFIDKNNIYENLTHVQNTINKFNQEIEWRNMWTREQSITRTNTNHKLFILLEGNNPLGHVWFNRNFLYNAFVSQERQDGDSMWFIEECIFEMNNKFLIQEVNLKVDSWNKRAIRFWEKLNFIKENDGYTEH